MKKLLLLIIIIAALFYLFKGGGNEVKTVIPDSSGGTFRPDPTLATFSGVEGEAVLLEERAYGELNNDEKSDVVVFLAESGGGSGVFIYAAAYVSGPVNYHGSNAVFLGDRVAPQNISIKNGVATITYLDRAPDEPLAAEPTFTVSKEFIYKNGEFVEK